MTLLGYDISHHQGVVNFAAAKAASRAFVVVKATEGTGYVDPMFTANRKAAHAAGTTVGIYHFARAGAAANEAAYFCGVIGALQPGEFLVLDWECAYGGDHVAWCKAWLDAVTAKTGVRPLIYMNVSTMNGHNWSPISSDYGLWLAKYDGSTAPPAVSSWAAAAMKQYSDAGTVLGVAGGCDVNVFYGDASALAAYGAGGADMPLTQADIEAIRHAVAEAPIGGTAIGGGKDVMLWTLLAAMSQQLFDTTTGTLNHDLRGDLKAKGDVLAAIQAAFGQVQAPVIDEAKLAVALLANPDAVQALGRAIAENLQLSPRSNG